MKVALIGTVGVPGRYGGFETLAENLVLHHKRTDQSFKLTVWCSSKEKIEKPRRFESANLRYVNYYANGAQSILYDIVCIFQAIYSGYDRILLLGVSGAIVLPLVRLFSNVRIITNIDGLEWKRDKWNPLVRLFLRISEWAAVRFSHEVIADNQAIVGHVQKVYGKGSHLISYGGDHALTNAVCGPVSVGIPERYALGLCRIESENNVHMILNAFVGSETPLVFVGNWDNSPYGRKLKLKYKDATNLYLLDPIYEPSELYTVRFNASLYVHGHSAGGTNPSLVEMMHFGVPVFAYDCSFNRFSTEDRAKYFHTSDELALLVEGEGAWIESAAIGRCMKEIADRCYTWNDIGEAYFELLWVERADRAVTIGKSFAGK